MSDAARRHAFGTHVEPEIDVMLRVARTLTGSAADAEDLVQEAVMRAWRSIDRFDGRYPRAWLLTILRNTHKNLHRRQRPHLAENPASHPRARPAFGTATAPGPEEVHVDRVFNDDLERAVDSLGVPFRTVLLLVDVDDLTYAEAASVLGVPVGTVMSRLSRARGRVRDHLRAHDVALRSGERR